MAYKTLTEFCTAIANAIRTATGTTAKIIPNDFPAKITDVLNKGFANGQKDVASKTTATDSDVLAGKKYWKSTNALGTGTMANYPSSYLATANTANGNRFQLKIPNTGKYAAGQYLYCDYSSVVSAFSITENKIVEGNTIAGIDGKAQKKWTVVGGAWAQFRDTDSGGNSGMSATDNEKNSYVNITPEWLPYGGSGGFKATITFKTAGTYRLIALNGITNTASGKHTGFNSDVYCAANTVSYVQTTGNWVYSVCFLVVKVG